MHGAETRALRRATLLLAAISVVRWGWMARAPAAPASGDTVLPELLTASRAAAEEEARRATPLGPDERVDLNRAGEIELDRLPGIGPSTARAIVAAREDGAVFRRAEDLLSVRGVGPATLGRIVDLVSVEDPPPARAARRRPVGSGPSSSPPSGKVDLNTAGREELERLPGIGPALAERILAARQEHMFMSLGDLVRVRGIGPATVERLRPHAVVGR